VKRGFLSLFFTFLFTAHLFGAEINHTVTEVTAADTTTSTSAVDVTGAIISNTFFSSGKKYWIRIIGQFTNTVDGGETWVQVVHGSTIFEDSEQKQNAVAADEYTSFGFSRVWTAIASEDIKVQFRTSTADTAKIDQIVMVAINLTDDLTESTDWFYNERSTDDGLTTTFLDGAVVTFTPGSAGDDWLVETTSEIRTTTAAASAISRMERTGEATSTLPEARSQAAFSGNHPFIFPLSRVFNLGASSNTFTEQSVLTSGTSATRKISTVFILNLDKFRNHADLYTEGDLALSATDWATELQSISITPDVAGDVLIGAYWGFDWNNTSREAEYRLQIGNTDDPPTQTSDLYQFAPADDVGDEHPMNVQTLPNLAASAHTIDLDASVDSTTGTPAGQHRSLWAFTMELPAGGAPIRRPIPPIIFQ